jgi:hypothetical protein
LFKARCHISKRLSRESRDRDRRYPFCMTNASDALRKRKMVSVRLSERDYEQLRIHAGGNMSRFLRQAARRALVANGENKRR